MKELERYEKYATLADGHYTLTITAEEWVKMPEVLFDAFYKGTVTAIFKRAFKLGYIRSYRFWRDADGTTHLEWKV